MKPSLFPTCLLVVAACASHQGQPPRVFPLVAGASTRSQVQRVDIDDRKPGPPALHFEVDCRGLPYAKGKERDVCYGLGSWAVGEHERGLIVACSCGEFGGFVVWYSKGGDLLQTLIAGDVPPAMIFDDESLLCVTGLTHGLSSLSRGAVLGYRLLDDRWQPVSSTALAKEAERIDINHDGSLVLKLLWDGGTFSYRAGVVEQIQSTSPPNTTQQPTGAPSGAGG